MEPEQTYAECAPPARLAPDVRCVWWSSFGSGTPILPDGCLDLIIGGDPAFIAGPDTRAATNELPKGALVRGIRFHTGRAHRVLGVPSDELRDQRVELSDLVTERLSDEPPAADHVVDHAVAALNHGGSRVAASLADLPDLAVSERQFRRRFVA